MQQSMIAALLDKYFQAETTVEEERVLAEYFRVAHEDLPAEWEPYRRLFGYYEEESHVGVSEGFDKKVLERIGVPRVVTMRHAPWWMAAAVILLSFGSIFLFAPQEKTREIAVQHEVTDTFEDPEQALAAIQKALFKAGKGLNTGRGITKKELEHFNQIHHAITN
jgi:hypothetical protein